MKVSIIIPCYNDGKYLQEVLPYALGQSYEDKEIIVVNDGSTDELTLRYLAEIDNKDFVTVVSQENQGLGRSRNNGINKANGEFILTWDADDYYDVKFLEFAVPNMLGCDQIKIVTAGVNHFGLYEDRHMPKEGGIASVIKGNSLPASALFRKTDWEKVNGYDENKQLATYADWDFWTRVLSMGGFVKVIPEYWFNYRVSSKSMYLSELENSEETVLKIIDKNKEIYRNHLVNVISKLHYERLILYKRMRELRLEKNEAIESKYNESKLFYLKKLLGL